MKSVLFGNGLIVQFGGRRYTNTSIVKRALYYSRKTRESEICYPKETAEFLETIWKEYPRIRRGDYDSYCAAPFIRESLSDFKKRYKTVNNARVGDIGIEDYFLMFDLVCAKNGIVNPDRYEFQVFLKRMFLDAIYDDGAIQRVHIQFPESFREYLAEFDSVFTLNYDANLEQCGVEEVHHLHGSFQTLSETYVATSFRNQVFEGVSAGESVLAGFEHLFSNCVMSFSGGIKEFALLQPSRANDTIEKLAAAYQSDPEMKAQIEQFDEGDELNRRIGEAVRLKVQNPSLMHEEQYPVKEIQEIDGELHLVGVSPYNDQFLFEDLILKNRVSRVVFYAFDESETPRIQDLLRDKEVQVKNVSALWETMKRRG